MLDVTASTTEKKADVYARLFTTCSQTAIEDRDTAITKAREIYNASMNEILLERKNGEKAAVAITDAGDKKDAIKEVVDIYRKNALEAQDVLTSSRKDIWEKFEADIELCREAKSDVHATLSASSTASTTVATTSQKTKEMKEKTSVTEKTKKVEQKEEQKTFRESFMSGIGALRSLFK